MAPSLGGCGGSLIVSRRPRPAAGLLYLCSAARNRFGGPSGWESRMNGSCAIALPGACSLRNSLAMEATMPSYPCLRTGVPKMRNRRNLLRLRWQGTPGLARGLCRPTCPRLACRLATGRGGGSKAPAGAVHGPLDRAGGHHSTERSRRTRPRRKARTPSSGGRVPWPRPRLVPWPSCLMHPNEPRR
jgi:hypothetical protein